MKNYSIVLLLMLKAFLSDAQRQEISLAGDWSGNFKKIQFVFHIEQNDTGYLSTIDILNNNLRGLKTNSTRISGDSLVIDGQNIGLVYKGAYNADSNFIEGTMTEGVNTVPLILKKGIARPMVVAKPNRPQEPVKPYPYREEEVVFNNNAAHIKLAGTLTLPGRGGKHPAVILITGSGPQNRDEEVYGHKPFLVLADYLTRQGFAVLRYDDRGVNHSTGSFADATTKDFATDALAAVNYLKSRKEIDGKQIGVIGHSEGAIIAPLVANRSTDVAFIVLLAGTGVPGTETMAVQAKTLRSFPVPDETAYDQFIREALTIAAADKEITVVKKELSEFYHNSAVLRSLLPPTADRDAFITNLVNTRTNTWTRYFYNYNPADALAKVKCPVLSLNGSKDKQVPAQVNQPPIKKALEKSGNKDFVVKELPGLNHFFQECTTGMPDEYNDIEQTISPVALQEVAQWLKAHTK